MRVVEGEEFAVVALFAPPREMALDAEPLGRARDRRRHLEQQRIGALAEADDEDLLAGLCLLERCDQHDQRVRRAGLATDGMQIVAHAPRPGMPAALATDGPDPRQGRRHAEMRDLGRLHAGLLEAARRSPPARSPDSRRRGSSAPPTGSRTPPPGAVVVDEVGIACRAGEETCDRLALADEDRGRAVSAGHLDRARGLGALVGGHDERSLEPRRGRRAPTSRRAACRRVRRRHVGGQLERRRDHAGIEPVEERKRRRGQAQLGDRAARPPVKASRAASTAMVTGSSSQLHMARSPTACDAGSALNQSLAATMALRASRRRGIGATGEHTVCHADTCLARSAATARSRRAPP